MHLLMFDVSSRQHTTLTLCTTHSYYMYGSFLRYDRICTHIAVIVLNGSTCFMLIGYTLHTVVAVDVVGCCF